MSSIVVVFDFDRTLLDVDSDNWVVTEMGLTALFRRLMPTMPWTALMNRMMEEVHGLGKTIDDTAECLRRAPIHPRTIAAIKSSQALGCDLKILSDANQFFIETILKHNGIFDCFSEIITNPKFVDEEGRLRILPYHDYTSAAHGCDLCPPNMCKGMVIDKMRSSEIEAQKRRFIYLGDGKGDYCPSIKLKDGDYVMPRKGYYLWEHIDVDPCPTKAKVYGWSHGDELEEILLRVINKILGTTTNFSNVSRPSADCKCEAKSPSTQESSHQTMRVRH